MSKRSLKQVSRLGAELWDWLAENPSKEKRNWPRWKCNGGNIKEPINNCFCCEYGGRYFCNECPIKWQGKYCNSARAEYEIWRKTKNKKTRIKYARKIAQLHRDILKETK